MPTVNVIGAGLAGCEAAYQLARCGISVKLFEMKPNKMSPAHSSSNFAELVCSNSLRSDELTNAAGLLKEELRRFSSLIMKCADANKVEAGGALAVDRNAFSSDVTNFILSEPNIEVIHEEVKAIPNGLTIIASGPLTSDNLADTIKGLFPDTGFLSFFDAAAPIVSADSINYTKVFFASRYDKGEPSYINCPMDKDCYLSFHNELTQARQTPVRGFEDASVFEGCMPVEVMARRGVDTLRYGPLKPVGLKNPITGREAYAIVQLRADNSTATLYNLVGFQTHLAFPEQKRVFSMIPGLENADFVRYGVMHRNTYINSPKLLDDKYRLISEPRIRFAGQITGVEGYLESAASGLLCAIETVRELQSQLPLSLDRRTAIGALAKYISDTSQMNFQPMNINFGIMEPLEYRIKGKRNKNAAISKRSLDILADKAGHTVPEHF